MKFNLTILILTASQIINAQAPAVLIMDGNNLAAIKEKLMQKDPSAKILTDSLLKAADTYLRMKPVSVMDKAFTPVSGNKHDYMSQAPYFWYDSSKPNGLPYIRRDGQHNPEIKKITDRTYIGDLEQATRTLALAWFFTKDENYASKAVKLIQTWFFDEATKMNPNLEYAQAIPGINSGRGIGIIETRTLTGIADATILLTGSKSWTLSDQKDLKEWYSQYLNWLLTSKNGNDEHAAKNNHGTWFYVQAIDLALFTGEKDKARKLVEESKKLLNNQLTAEGKWPLELERTNALGYSTFNTTAWFQVAKLAEQVGIDLWHYKTSKGATLQTSLDWLIPYAIGEKKWIYEQIGNYNQNEFYPLLLIASKKYNNPGYLKKASALSNNKTMLASLLN